MAVAMVSAVRGGRLPSLHHHHRRQMILSSSSSSSITGSWGSLRPWKQLNCLSNSKGFTLLARYSQAQDLFSSRFQGTLFLSPFHFWISCLNFGFFLIFIWFFCLSFTTKHTHMNMNSGLYRISNFYYGYVVLILIC